MQGGVSGASSDRRARLLLVDAQVLVVAGLRKLLEGEYEVVGVAGDGHSAVEATGGLKPDVVLLDPALYGVSGAEMVRQVKRTCPETKVVVVTAQADRRMVLEALRAGASGFILKSSSVAELDGAIREALAGRIYLSPLLRDENVAPAELTGRQMEVLRLIAEGHGTKEVATLLNISTKTVEFHKAGMMQRLGVHSVRELTRHATERGIIRR